uniref:HSF_DOMAIN domain-containing protein n=1 Tax=Heterorhabditis bacteriophora TaxID=37862 RepID=A0A1I7WGA5_HETBA
MILSLQRQTIHVMKINEDGLFVPLKEIGPSVQDDDGLYLFSDMSSTFLRTSFTSGLKQRLNTFLYRRAKKQGRIAEFLRSAGYRSLLRIHRAQLFDVHFLLIRMIYLSFCILDSGVRLDINTMPCFFVILDWRTCKILEVFDQVNFITNQYDGRDLSPYAKYFTLFQ